MMVDADALIKELRADIDVHQGRGSYIYTDGVIHGLNIAIGEVREAVKAAEKQDPDMKLTENELTICRATGAKWVTRDNTPTGHVNLHPSEEKPWTTDVGYYYDANNRMLATMDARVFPSLERGDCIKVPGE